MEMTHLNDLFLDELRDTYNGEQQILKALPKMAKKATAPDLQKAFEKHLKETEGHVKRLEQIFDLLGTPAKGKKCKGLEGIIAEGKEMIEESEEPVLDAVLIAAAQKVEHYEIAGYGTLKAYAELMGNTKVARLLDQTLNEEKSTDEKLTMLAESHINIEAEEGVEA